MAHAFSPGSVTMAFAPVVDESGKVVSSPGLAFSTAQGATTTLFEGKGASVSLNGEPFPADFFEDILRRFPVENISIQIETELPLGAGFGMSASITLSALRALNVLYPRFNEQEIVDIATQIEIGYRNGIGDVTTQQHPGVILREGDRLPMKVTRLKVKETDLSYRVFSTQKTKFILSDQALMESIRQCGFALLARIDRDRVYDFSELIAMSTEFVRNSGLDQRLSVREELDAVLAAGFQACPVLLGSSLMAVGCPGPEWRPLRLILKED